MQDQVHEMMTPGPLAQQSLVQGHAQAGERPDEQGAAREGERPGLPAAELEMGRLTREVHVVDHVVRSPTGKPDYRWARDVAVQGGAVRAPT